MIVEGMWLLPISILNSTHETDTEKAESHTSHPNYWLLEAKDLRI